MLALGGDIANCNEKDDNDKKYIELISKNVTHSSSLYIKVPQFKIDRCRHRAQAQVVTQSLNHHHYYHNVHKNKWDWKLKLLFLN